LNSELRLPQYISVVDYKLWSRLEDDYMKTMRAEVIEVGVDDFIEHKWKLEFQGYPLPYIRNCTGVTNQQIMEMNCREVTEVIQNVMKTNPLSTQARTISPMISTNIGRNDKSKRRIRDCKRIEDLLKKAGMEPLWQSSTGLKAINFNGVNVGALLECTSKDWVLVTDFHNHVVATNKKVDTEQDPKPMVIE